jgi:hypothetical protein
MPICLTCGAVIGAPDPKNPDAEHTCDPAKVPAPGYEILPGAIEATALPVKK